MASNRSATEANSRKSNRIHSSRISRRRTPSSRAAAIRSQAASNPASKRPPAASSKTVNKREANRRAANRKRAIPPASSRSRVKVPSKAQQDNQGVGGGSASRQRSGQQGTAGGQQRGNDSSLAQNDKPVPSDGSDDGSGVERILQHEQKEASSSDGKSKGNQQTSAVRPVATGAAVGQRSARQRRSAGTTKSERSLPAIGRQAAARAGRSESEARSGHGFRSRIVFQRRNAR